MGRPTLTLPRAAFAILESLEGRDNRIIAMRAAVAQTYRQILKRDAQGALLEKELETQRLEAERLSIELTSLREAAAEAAADPQKLLGAVKDTQSLACSMSMATSDVSTACTMQDMAGSLRSETPGAYAPAPTMHSSSLWARPVSAAPRT